AQRIDELRHLSRKSFSKGEIDEFAERVGKGRAREPLPKVLFSDFREWRRMLSKNIMEHSRMNKLTKEQVDEGVQKLLNRFVFIRTCEDRKLENQRLQEAVRLCKEEKKKKLTRYLSDIFFDFNDTYDSDLFAPHLAGELYVDDHVMESLIEGLYKYTFDDIDADVLGNVYEQYLASVLREGGGLREKDSKRKEMGIYYTPTYIVDYIVKNTVGELVKNAKTHEELEKIRILDPACGSGSFLIRAFSLLNGAYAKKNGGDQEMLGENVSRNAYTALTKNLFGVDLDPKAVEIAELNLLLRAARKRGRLPLLSSNIKRGNSLISGTPEELEKYFGKQWKEKHPFNWGEEFAEVMNGGGFDVVIGNPPYMNVKRGYFEDEKKWLEDRYETAKGQYDLYRLFLERAIKLCKDGGFISFIIPRRAATNENEIALRRFILDRCKIVKIAECGAAFEDASVENVIFVLQKCSDEKNREENAMLGVKLSTGAETEISKVVQKQFRTENNLTFNIGADKKVRSLLSKIEDNGKPFSDFFETTRGIEAGKKDACVTTNKTEFPLLRGEDVGKYSIKFAGIYCKFSSKDQVKFKPETMYRVPEKLLVRRVGSSLISTVDRDGFFNLNTIYNSIPKGSVSVTFCAAILNSRLINFWFKQKFVLSEKIFPYVRISQLNQIPIPVSDVDSIKKQIESLADKMLDLNRRLNEFGDKQTSERQNLEEEIQRTDRQIDELVYKLYGITEEERKTIEESLKA
ncbi:MAG: N-6 DNA methylase, partial [Candidatus Micrarchaeota archaeon]|nr:N-6 DNA methylase [Candidatus Micrarchaeota archaeon]